MDNEEKSHFDKKYFEAIDEISEDSNYFTPVLKEVGSVVNFKSAHVLDVGCGTGIFLKHIIDKGCSNCIGIDGPSEFMSRAIKRGYKDVRIIDDLNAEPLPFSDNLFDLVVCKDVFEHLLNPRYVLSEIHRVLKKGQFLILHVPNHFPVYARFKFLFHGNIDTFGFFPAESRWTYPHIRFFEHKDSLNIFEEQGFTVERNLSFYFPSIPVLSRFKIFNSVTKWLTLKSPTNFACGFTYLLKKK
jgi:methionine biosynthesis protein MetW